MSVAILPTDHQIGANHPPPEDPFGAFDTHLSDLLGEARNFLDGAGVNSEGEAEAVSKLLDLIRTAGKDADKARAAEKRPHDDAGKAVQAKWKPLLDRAEIAVDACKKALTPWLQKKAAEQAAAAEVARREADARAAAAAGAMRQADATDLTAREAAEALVTDARLAEADATRAEKARPQAAGGARATTLRTSYRAEMTDAREALRHYLATQPDAIKASLQQLADADLRRAIRTIPGFTIHAEQTVV